MEERRWLRRHGLRSPHPSLEPLAISGFLGLDPQCVDIETEVMDSRNSQEECRPAAPSRTPRCGSCEPKSPEEMGA